MNVVSREASSRLASKAMEVRTLEVAMNKFRLATVLPALMLGLAFPASAANSVDQAAPGATMTGQPDQTSQSPSAISQDSTSVEKSAPKDQADKRQAKAKKHPPTAVMDRATPAEKSASDAATSGTHGPTSVMDRATPEQKSPEATSSASQGAASEPPASAK
jgi:hypothetical protein